VRGVVADQLQRLGVAIGEDRYLRAVGERRREVAQLAVDADRQRRLGKTRPDRRRRVRTGGSAGQLQRRAVGKRNGDLLRRGLDPAMLPTPHRSPSLAADFALIRHMRE
jgi:hypothetical protein